MIFWTSTLITIRETFVVGAEKQLMITCVFDISKKAFYSYPMCRSWRMHKLTQAIDKEGDVWPCECGGILKGTNYLTV